MTWSPDLYTKFEDERTRPVRDLLNAVAANSVVSAVDLGCGPGNSTEVLARRFADARVLGLDSSQNMIDAARRRLPGLTFELADIARWDAPAKVDLILSNAALQWVADHAALLPRLAGMLTGEGVLAVQMPDNLTEPSQMLMRDVAAEGPWSGRLSKAVLARTPILDATYYYDLLKPLCSRVDIWRTVYMHPLPGTAAIVAWFKSTGLRPFLAPLDKVEQTAFIERYEAKLAEAYAAQIDGTILLEMPRLFIVARCI